MYKKTRFKYFLTVLSVVSVLLSVPNKTKAQEFALSLYPPILEVTIMPGKSVTQTYILSNQGEDLDINVYLIPFLPSNETGSVELKDKEAADYQNWFRVEQPKVAYGETFTLKKGKTQDVVVSLTPPGNIAEGDYYFTLIFSNQPVKNTIPSNIAQTSGQIGSNILISVSKDGRPKKDALVKEFSAPRLIDSFSPLIYKLRVENAGLAFFKPNGKITVDQSIGENLALGIAPLNILVNSTREIICLEEENLIECKVDSQFLLGKYLAKVEFTLDDEGKVYTASVQTIALPFSLIVAVILILIFLKLIKGKFQKR